MAIQYIQKKYGVNSTTALADDATGRIIVPSRGNAGGVALDLIDFQLKYNNGNGALKFIADTTTAQTLTNKTITGATISGTIASDTKVLAAQADYSANIVAATITGFSWTVVAGATYVFEVDLPTIMTAVGGLTVSFKLTTATLTSIQYATYAATAADNTTAVSTNGTTTTDATKVFDDKASAYTHVTFRGSMVVNAGGTFAWQACQNTSAGGGDATSIRLGAFARLTRVL